MSQAVPHRLRPQLALERLDAAARHHSAAAHDHRSACFVDAIFQPKACCGVNPMPTLGLCAAGSLTLRLPPIITLADVPCVDLQNQCKWLADAALSLLL